MRVDSEFNVVVREGASILELLPGEDKALLVGDNIKGTVKYRDLVLSDKGYDLPVTKHVKLPYAAQNGATRGPCSDLPIVQHVSVGITCSTYHS